jgi:hypothetical protein
MIPVSIVVYWMMILWLKEMCQWWFIEWWLYTLKQSDTCVNGGLLNDDILIKESDTCVNGGLLNDDNLIKTKWYLCHWWFTEWWYFD